MNLPISIPVCWKQQLTFLFEIVVRSNAINIIFQSPENLSLVDTDILLDFFHFLFMKGLSRHRLTSNYIVEGITEVFYPYVHIFALWCQQVASREDEISVKVDVRLFMKKYGSNVKSKSWYRIAGLELAGKLNNKLGVFRCKVLLHFESKTESTVRIVS